LPFSVAEAARLEKSLLHEGDRINSNWNVLIASTNEWYRAERQRGEPSLAPEVVAFLCEILRSSENSTAKTLAAGALLLAQQHGAENRHRVAFAARLAINRIHKLTTTDLGWAEISLSGKDHEDALALFDAARGDQSYKIDELVENARVFIEQY